MADELSREDERLLSALRSWALASPITDEVAEVVEEQDRPKVPPRLVARTMLRTLEGALVDQGHPFPRFSARLKAIRFAARDPEEVARKLDVALPLLARFESGEVHPAWFPRPATIAAARLLPTEADWRKSIAEAFSRESPEALPLSAEEKQAVRDPWVEALNQLLALAEAAPESELTTPAARVSELHPPEVSRLVAGTPVRRLASGEVGVVLRWVSGSLYEVSLPSGMRLLSLEELEGIEDTLAARLAQRRIGRTPLFAHRLQALYLLHAYRYDELAGLTSARVEPKPHQVFVAWRVLQKVRPRMILADEVGLGKTIEAGIILKELRARGLAERTLFIVPASLVGQWVWEFKSKFNIELEVFDGPKLKDLRRRHRDTNPWTLNDTIICSLPFASRDAIADEIAEAEWDVVVFDEAHRVRRHRDRATKAYHLADELRFDTHGMLLLTATPMQLDSFELYSLIELIEPGLFAGGFDDFESKRRHVRHLNELMLFLNEYEGLPRQAKIARCQTYLPNLRQFLSLNGHTPEDAVALLDDPEQRQDAERRLLIEHPLVEVMVRNRKSAIPEVFAHRDVVSQRVQPTPLELEAHERVTQYIRQGFALAMAKKNMPAGFLMVTFHKMLTSSSHALARSFERRVGRLRASLAKLAISQEPAREPALVGGDGGKRGVSSWDSPKVAEWRDAEEASAALDDVLDSIIEAEATRAEIDQLSALVELLDRVQDSKLDALKAFLEDIFGQDSSEKVIIFTQFVETQFSLRDALADRHDVHIFNGRQKPEDKDKAVQRFRDGAERQILISTEAGGEGRNFQFAHVLVNYDLPWNPMRIEQRIGRIDRIGQKSTVVIRNFVLAGTLDERVFAVLQDRINVFEESIGSLDPILGDVEDAIRRVALELTPAELDRAFEALGVSIEERVHHARRMQEQLQDFVMDHNSLRLDEANRLLNRKPLANYEDLSRFVNNYLQFHGGSVDPHAQGGDVVTLPLQLGHRLRTRENRVRGTFSPTKALEFEELGFFAVGHPLIDRILEVAALPSPESELGAYVEESDVGGYGVDLYYRAEASGVEPSAHFVRHRVMDGRIDSHRLRAMPLFGKEIPADEVQLSAEDIREAIARSEEQIAHEIDSIRREVQLRNETMRERELERAHRINVYRRQKELQTILDQEGRLRRIESGTPEERRLLPAIQGRIEKARQRLERIELDYEDERASIEGRARVEVSFELVGAALVKLVVR